MKDLYYIYTNGYDLVASVDEDGFCRYLTSIEYDGFPILDDTTSEETKEKCLKFLEEIEDDSSWETDCTLEELLEGAEIIVEAKKEL